MKKTTQLALILSVFTFAIFSCKKDNNGDEVYDIIRTSVTDQWGSWDMDMSDSLNITLSKFGGANDNWSYNHSGETIHIKTKTSEDWDSWEVQSAEDTILFETASPEDFNNWNISSTETSWSVKATCLIAWNWNSWTISQSGETLFLLRTNNDNNFNNWYTTGDFPGDFTTQERVSVFFVPIFIGALFEQGIVGG